MPTSTNISPKSAQVPEDDSQALRSGWARSSSHWTMGLISPPDSRRTSDNKSELPSPQPNATVNQFSLPSLHEALSRAAPEFMSHGSETSSTLPSARHLFGYSPPQINAPSRPFTLESTPPHSQNGSSQATPPASQNTNALPQLASETATSRTQPSQMISTAMTSPAVKEPGSTPLEFPKHGGARHEQEFRANERGDGTAYQFPVQYPTHNQYRPSPDYFTTAVPSLGAHQPNASQFNGSRSERLIDWRWKESLTLESTDFRPGLKRQFDPWEFGHNIVQVNTSGRVLTEWSHRSHTALFDAKGALKVPCDKWPTIQSCNEMIEQGEYILSSLTKMKNMIAQQEHYANDQRTKEQVSRTATPTHRRISHDDGAERTGLSNSEGKRQRRGRAAPPGRCHSCNRAETPEWRRGPDGARTLCNACGLHYAKLTRKQSKSQSNTGSSLRPHGPDDSRPIS